MRLNEIAAIIHADMATDDRNGYSWDPRWGGDHPDGWKVLWIDGREYGYPLGSWDCSSSTTWAWRQALRYTPWEGMLDGATYTGNMYPAFMSTGLFEAWDTYSSEAYRGDLYLNEGSHVAMCQYGGQDGTWDSLSEASINEFGEVYGGRVGDQTGNEIHITDYYNCGWDETLHYNGLGDDTQGDSGTAEQEIQPGQSIWQGDVIGRECTMGSGDDYAGVFGKPILYIAIEGVGEYQAHDKGKSPDQWWSPVSKYDLQDEENGMAGSGIPIDALRIFDKTVSYQTHNLGDPEHVWNEVLHGTEDTSEYGEDYAGIYGIAIDAIRVWRESGEQPRTNVFS